MARWIGTAHTHFAAGHSLFTFAGLLMGLCATIMVVGLCSVASRRKRIRDKVSSDRDDSPPGWHFGRGSKKPLGSKGDDQESKLQLISTEQVAEGQGLHRPPVWQRTILMGERCQTPSFSGLILYDERGNLLPIKSARDL